MRHEKFYVVIVLVLTLSFSTQALASLTFTADAIIGTTASSIDLGVGNDLNLQTTGNGAINLGSGLLTSSGGAVFGGNLGIAGTVIDDSRYVNLNVTGIDGVTSYGGYFSVSGNGGTLDDNETSLIGLRGIATRASGEFTHGAVVGVLGNAYVSSGVSTDNMTSLVGETQVQGSTNQGYGTSGQILAYGAGSIGQAYGVYADAVAIQTSSIADAYGAIAKVRQSNTATITRAYGLALSGWSGTAGTSYGIYMDNSIDIGSTRYAIYSTSTSNSYLAGALGIGTATPNANAALDVSSTTKAFMPPRMTTTQRDAIPSPTAGMLIYNLTTNKLNVYTTTWEAVTSL